jgi:hypothetical protein
MRAATKRPVFLFTGAAAEGWQQDGLTDHALRVLHCFSGGPRGGCRAAGARTCYQRLVDLWQSFPEQNEYVDRQKAAATRLLASLH